MKPSIGKRFIARYFSPRLDFRVKLFNVLAIGGIAISFCVAVLGAVIDSGPVNVVTNLGIMALSFLLLTVSRRTGRYQLCYMISIAVIFMCLFPVLFFSAGGYHSGMPAFFVFAVAFTVSMLEGKNAIFFSVAELALYIAICIVAYLHPETVHFFETESDVFLDVIVAFTAVSVVLGICMFFHFRLYNDQQRRLDEQNAVLAQISRGKTEFLANTSHEMRTPLTVISVDIQKVMYILEDMGKTADDPEATRLLADAQSEIMRLSRMVGGMLTLASISENPERRKTDFTALLQSASDILALFLQKRNNEVKTEIAEDLTVFGDSDLLSQVIVNLIQNAHAHTENDAVLLRAVPDRGKIMVTVSDNGAGIAPDLLPRVFERGVSGGGGTGVGLHLCKTVVESHGGEIWIDSEPGKGTAVYFTVPVYGGQYGGGAV